MQVILLSGGSGKRLWPLSNDVRSKQFIQIFRNDRGELESMLQRVYGQIKSADPDADVVIATSQSQVSAIRNQLGDQVEISIEPCRRDTFPAIALSAVYLKEKCGAGDDEVVVVCPVDPYVGDDYFKCVKELSDLAATDQANLCLMGIAPTYPSEKYGYILPESAGHVSKVKMFREKPDAKTAQEYIDQGGLWNGGVFAFRLGYILKKAHALISFTDYQDLYEKYETLDKISFDYAVSEKEAEIAMLKFDGEWKDVGSWNTMAEAMSSNRIGDVTIDETCENVTAINELNMPILTMGMKDAIIVAAPDGILVADKAQSSYMKPYVEKMEGPVRYMEKSWGSFTILDAGKESLTVKVLLNPGHHMNYHSHDRRDEAWTIVSGSGVTIIDGLTQKVGPGDVITIQAGCKHTIIAESELQLIEVQIGSEISVRDKHKYEMPQGYLTK